MRRRSMWAWRRASARYPWLPALRRRMSGVVLGITRLVYRGRPGGPGPGSHQHHLDILRRQERKYLAEQRDGGAWWAHNLEGTEDRAALRGVLHQYPEAEEGFSELHHGHPDQEGLDLLHKELRPGRSTAHLPIASPGAPANYQGAWWRHRGASADGSVAGEPYDPAGSGPEGHSGFL